MPDGRAGGRVRRLARPFVAGSVEPRSRVITDGWGAYNGLATLGYAHERRNQKAAARRGQDPGELLPAVHRVASLCKRWLLGTHQGRVEPAHLQAYLNEFAFRFNRPTRAAAEWCSTASWNSPPGTTRSVTTTSAPPGSRAASRRSNEAPATRPAWTAQQRPGPGEPLKCSFSFHSA